MGVRSMAQDLVGSEAGPATTPGPSFQEETQEDAYNLEKTESDDLQETVERATLTNERAGQSLVDQGIGIMVAVIVVGAVAIPVVQDVVSQTNVTGMAGNILEYVTLALALGLFVAAISIVR